MPHPPKHNKNRTHGGSLVELVIVAAIIAGALSVIVSLAAVFFVSSSIVAQTSEATALAQETLEALRNYRDGVPWDLDTFGAGAYHVEKIAGTPPTWNVVSGAETIGIYTRQVELEALRRNSATHDLDPSGAFDFDSVEATVTVSWQERGRSHEVKIVTYLMNWQQL